MDYVMGTKKLKLILWLNQLYPLICRLKKKIVVLEISEVGEPSNELVHITKTKKYTSEAR